MGIAAVPIALSAVGAVAGGAQASQNNRAVRRSARSAQLAAQVQGEQVAARTAVEKLRLRRQAAQIGGRVRVGASGRGVAAGTSFDRQLRQVAIDQATNSIILGDNLTRDIDAIESNLDARLADLSARLQSVVLSAVGGGLGGFTAGIAIDEGVSRIGESFNPAIPAGPDRDFIYSPSEPLVL